MGCRIVVGHRPGDGQETEEEAKADRRPARGRLDVGEDVGSIMFILGQYQQRNRARDQDEDVKDNIGFGHLLHPVRRQGVDRASQDGQRGHHPDGCICCNLIVEISPDADSREKHLSGSILGGGDTRNLSMWVRKERNPTERETNLAEEIDPPRNPIQISEIVVQGRRRNSPAKRRYPFGGREAREGEV